MDGVEYRIAHEADLPAITAFVDFWLAGRGLVDSIPGSAHDYFVPAGRHLKYITKYTTVIALIENHIIGWSVKTHLGVLIHLLVAGTFRHRGIGTELLRRQDPDQVRSKMDQAAGNPAEFYQKRGYLRSSIRPTTKKNNIELFAKSQNQPASSLRRARPRPILAKPRVKPSRHIQNVLRVPRMCLMSHR